MQPLTDAKRPPIGGLYYESMTLMSSRQTHSLKGENLLFIYYSDFK